MKKVLILLAMSLAFTSCFSQKKAENVKQTEEKEVQPLIYEHNQVLKFIDSGYNTQMIDKPFSEKVVYTIQKGDEIKISEILVYESKIITFVKATTSSGIVGYIYIGYENPYRNGDFSYLKTIEVDGKDIRILKLSKSYNVGDYCIYSLPSENSTILHKITHEEGGKYYESSEITEDYKWVKITIKEWTGWVRSKWLSLDKGGPVIKTPESVIFFELIGKNEI